MGKMLDHPIAVLGGGHMGHQMAADFTLAGYKVNFYEHPQFEDAVSTHIAFESSFKAALQRGMIEVYDQRTERTVQAKIHKITTDMNEAVGDAKIIFVAIPSFGHDIFFDTMIPYLKDEHVVVVMSGNLGALRLRHLMRQRVPERKVVIYETNVMPGSARITGPGKVQANKSCFGPWHRSLGGEIQTLVHFPYLIAAVPSKSINVALKEIQELYPRYMPTENVLVEAMNHPHHLIHVPLVVLNVARTESLKEDFVILVDGQTPSVQKVQAVICDELAQMVKAVGGTHTLSKGLPQETVDRIRKHPIIFGKEGIKNRFVTEDCPYGLVPMIQLGDKLGVPTPVMKSFVLLASIMNDEDYNKTGRTLESLGLDKLNVEQMIDYVQNEE